MTYLIPTGQRGNRQNFHLHRQSQDLVDNTASSGKKTALSYKPTKPKLAATTSPATRDDPKDKDFSPPKNPHPCSESPIEDIPLDKYGN